MHLPKKHFSYDFREILSPAMTLGDRSISAPEDSSDRTSNDVTSSKNHSIRTSDGDPGCLEQTNDTSGCAGREEGVGSTRRKVTDVVCVESSDENRITRYYAHLRERTYPSTSFSGLTASVTNLSPSEPTWGPSGS